MALNAIEKKLIEMIRSEKEVTVVLKYNTNDEIAITVGGRAPHDIALAVQSNFINSKKD